MIQTETKQCLVRGGLIVLLSACLLSGIFGIVKASADSRTPILAVKTRDIAFYSPTLQAFLHGLDTRGYSTARDVSVTVIALTGDAEKDRRMLHEQMQKSYRLIFTLGTDATRLVADQKPTVPVLFSMILDPQSLGVVKSPEAPGGEFTGTTLLVSAGKQLDTLLQIAPSTRRVGVLYTDGDPASLAILAQAQREAKRLSIEVVGRPVGPQDTDKAATDDVLGRLAGQVDAFWLIPDPASTGPQALAETLACAKTHGLPVLGASAGSVRAGALLSLSANLPDLGDVSAEMAALLLAGSAQPMQMPVRGPRRTLLSLNLVTANALGRTIPDAVLHLADDVIDADTLAKNGNSRTP